MYLEGTENYGSQFIKVVQATKFVLILTAETVKFPNFHNHRQIIGVVIEYLKQKQLQPKTLTQYEFD